MRVTSADGTSIALHEIGAAEGPRVLLLHGFASSTQRNWLDAGWGRAFEEAGFCGISMDLRGHGDSGKPSGEASYAVDRFIEDVDAALALLDVQPGEKLGCLGYSMGARLAYRYAGAHPAAFAALALGGLPASDPFEDIDREMADAALRGEVEPTGGTAFIVQLATLMPEAEPETLLDVAFGVAKTHFTPSEHPPAVPTLFMSGDKDERAVDTETMVPLLDDARFLPIPGRNHINAITSRKFKTGVLEFLAEQLA